MAIEAAIKLQRGLCEIDAPTYKSSLLVYWKDYAKELAELKEFSQALEINRERGQIYRDLVSENNFDFNQDFALALIEVAFCLSKLRKDKEASAFTREASTGWVPEYPD